jgi:hypothetical protein
MISYIYKLLTKHPKEVGLSYFQHLYVSVSISINFFTASIKALIHSFLPFMFETSSSDTIKYLDLLIKETRKKND